MTKALSGLNPKLVPKGIRFLPLKVCRNRALIYAYRPHALKSDLAEQLEESEFDPMFTDCENSLKGKNIALFGSYGWGDGEWMRTWESRCGDDGATLVCDSESAMRPLTRMLCRRAAS